MTYGNPRVNPTRPPARSSALTALADPTRRRVFERLRAGPKPVGQIARGLPVSRPAVSQHLKVLKEAGLVTDRALGASRIYAIDPRGLAQVRRWLDQFWDEELAAFKAEAEATAPGSEAAGIRKAIRKKEEQP